MPRYSERNRVQMGFVLACIGLLVAAAQAYCASPPSKLVPGASCTTSDCHGKLLEIRRVHEPLVGGECGMCHEARGDKHSFTSPMSGTELCLACHEDPSENKHVHSPAADDCLTCHNPHGSANPAALKTANQKELCFACHDEDLMAGEYQHGPAAVGACSMCHDPHGGPDEKFLKLPGKALCTGCHIEMGEMISSLTYPHKPVEENCAACHNPHSSSHAKLLSASPQDVCGACHKEIVETAASSAVEHGPLKSERGCLGCHAPHGASSAGLLLAPQVELCLGCHNRPMVKGDRTLPDMMTLLETNKEWHSPLREDGCTGCHEPHGGARFSLLAESYPPKFYSAYDPENYALCFTCHESTLVKDQYTRTLTGFRDGEVNLHFLHVNKTKRGRTCRACHEVHASRLPRHIRDSVPYGAWELPIGYTRTEKGGTCQPGCHAPKTYERTIKK